MNEWLKKLEVGDVVILSYAFNKYSFVKIERFTKTQIVLESTGTKFRRDDGYQVGGSTYYSSILKEATPELISEIKGRQRRKVIIDKINAFNFSKAGIDHLERILKAMEG